jgi:tetratricopeptide (TPR) repeat protein
VAIPAYIRNLFPAVFLAIATRPSLSIADDNSQQPEQILEELAASRLAEEFVRVAHTAVMSELLTTDAITTAVVLISEAAKLSPNNESIWRTMVEVAQMADMPVLRREAIRGLLLTSPRETKVQLSRLRDAIDRTNTVDQRMKVYEKLLSDGRSNLLDSRVAARLSLDAAHLQRQVGDVNQFARWLAESVALDPSYPDAITLAAGFFGDESADVYQRAELLASAVLSNIRDTTTQVALAEYLMAFGDYKDAKAIYENVLSDNAGDQKIISSSLLADIAISQWAAGDSVAALDTILARQQATDKIYRNKTRQSQPRISPLELARIHAPLSPKLSTTRAIVFSELDDPSQKAIAVDSAVGSILSFAKLYESQGETNSTRVVDLYLQAAWVSIWLGEDVDTARLNIDHVKTIATIDPVEQNRLEGWIALRNTDLELAKTILTQIKSDAAAQVGLAMIALSEGNEQEAARELLKVARDYGGTMLGVWSRNQLLKIVKADFEIRPEVQDLQKLMEGVLQTIDLYVKDPRPPVQLRVDPEVTTFGPYEPILVNVSLTNNTTIPITIAKNGPLQPLLLIQVVLEIPGAKIDSVPPIIIPIDNELSIRPRETLVIQTDLRQQWIGGVVNSFPLQGASVRLKSTINFTARETKGRTGRSMLVYEAGRIGMKDETEGFRIDGVRLNDVWVNHAIERASSISSIDDLTSMVLLTWTVADNVDIKIEKPLIPPPEGEGQQNTDEEEQLRLKSEAVTTVLSNFPGLGPMSQAWVVSTMSDDPTIEAVVGMMSEPESTISQLSWIVRFVENTVPDEVLDDNRLLAARESEDKSVRIVANWTYKWVERISKEREARQLSTPVPGEQFDSP